MSSQASERNFQDDFIAAMQANGWLLGKGAALQAWLQYVLRKSFNPNPMNLKPFQ